MQIFIPHCNKIYPNIKFPWESGEREREVSSDTLKIH